MKRNFTILFFLGLILSISLVLADTSCQPAGVPKFYSGNVYYNGFLLEGNYLLNATIGGKSVGLLEFSNGVYNKIAINPCVGVTGDIIFLVNGEGANERGYYSGNQDEWGIKNTITNFTLTLNNTPPEILYCGDGNINSGEECDDDNLNNGDGCSSTCEKESGYKCVGSPSICTLLYYCGDGYCSGDETCSSCSIDCGVCPNTNTGGGGGSSGGGGGGVTTYTPVSSENGNSNNENNSELDLLSDETKTQTENKPNTNFFRLQGKAIGDFVTSGTGLIIIGIIIALAVALIIVLYYKKK